MSDGAAGLLSSDPLPVPVEIPEDDATKPFTVVTMDDEVDEADGTLTAMVTEDDAYDVAAPSSATVVITDNDLPVVSITAGVSSVTEGTDATAAFTVSRPPTGDVTGDLMVSLTVDGGAADFLEATQEASPSVTIPAGAATHAFEVVIVDDATDEVSGTLTVSIALDAAYLVSSSSGTASVEVADDDPILVSITGGGSAAEGAAAAFTVARGPRPGLWPSRSPWTTGRATF